MSQAIDIVSLYPKDMNIYGDSGYTATNRTCMPTIRATSGPSTST